DAVFVSQLAESLRGRGYQLQLIGELCRHTTIKTLDAIVTLDVDRETFRQIGFNCFYPLICVDGLVDDSFLFYQVNNDFAGAAEQAGRHGGRTALVFEAYAEPRLNARAGARLDAVCSSTGEVQLREFAA